MSVYYWTAERVEALRELAHSGLSLAEIACALPEDERGRRPTTNAVAGKLHRLSVKTETFVTYWTDSHIEILKQLAAQRMTAVEIVDSLPETESGQKPTRAAVLSKLAHLNIHIGRVRAQEVRVIERKAAKTRANEKKETDISDTDWSRRIEAPGMPEGVKTGPEAVLSLREGLCSFPVGDPTADDFRYCCADADDGKPYCQHHMMIAYKPARTATEKAARYIQRYNHGRQFSGREKAAAVFDQARYKATRPLLDGTYSGNLSERGFVYDGV